MSTQKTPWPLIISVGLNLILVGLLAGIMINLGTHDRSPHRSGHQAGPRIERPDLTPASRRAVHEAWRSARATSTEARDRREQARATLQDVLTAETFDPDAAKAAFEALRDTETALQTAMQDSLIERMTTMSAGERTRLAARLTRRRGRR